MGPGEEAVVKKSLPESNDYDSTEWEEFSDRVTWEDDVHQAAWEDNGGFVLALDEDE